MTKAQQEQIKAAYQKERPDLHPFDTLLKSKHNSKEQRGYSNAWYPAPKSVFEDAFLIFDKKEKDKYDTVIQNNIVYNLQYLQFLEKELAELSVSQVIRAALIKTYVITCVSIIEGLFSYILKARGLWKPKSQDELTSSQTKEKSIDEQKYVFETTVYKIIPEENRKDYSPMHLSNITSTAKYYKSLQLDKPFREELEALKELRNRIHLQNMDIESEKDHDYNTFSENIKYGAGSILYRVITLKYITKTSDIFDFLKANVDAYKPIPEKK